MCINKRDGTKLVLSQPASKHAKNVDFKTLVNSLQKLQKEANAELTVMVENDKTKSVISGKATCIQQSSQNMESDGIIILDVCRCLL